MSGTIQFNPMPTTNFGNTFSVQSDGFIQGVALDDPAVRYALAGGLIDPTSSDPLWGGLPIEELTGPQSAYADAALGNLVRKATTLSSSYRAVTGFTVFNQLHSGLIWPQSRVPVVQPGMSVNFYRLGSGVRIPVRMDPGLVDQIGNGIVVSAYNTTWDFNNNCVALKAATGNLSITSMTWSSTNGGECAIVTPLAAPVSAVGDFVNISGAVNGGSGGDGLVNGNFELVSFTDNQHFTVAMPASAGEISSINVSGATLNGDTLALSSLGISILQVQVGNSKTVLYDSDAGTANWDPNGATALLLLGSMIV